MNTNLKIIIPDGSAQAQPLPVFEGMSWYVKALKSALAERLPHNIKHLHEYRM